MTLSPTQSSSLASTRIDSMFKQLSNWGVSRWCLASGSRNAPLLTKINQLSPGENRHFVDERVAAFYALGWAKASSAPVGIVVTSGTALAELLPAVVEAFYQSIPLVILSADRPRAFRYSGAPQCIAQVGIFGAYAPQVIDVGEHESFSFDLQSWTRRTPLHINVCFEEPMFNEKLESECAPSSVHSFAALEWSSLSESCSLSNEQLHNQCTKNEELVGVFLENSQRPLVVLGPLKLEARQAVLSFLCKLGAPVYAEAHSQLRGERALAELEIRGGESCLDAYNFDGLLRIGDVPTLRFWRSWTENNNLEERLTLSISQKVFSGRVGGAHICLKSYEECESLFFNQKQSRNTSTNFIDKYREFSNRIRAVDSKAEEHLRQLFSEYPHSELTWVNRLSRMVQGEALIYLGNSLPIREWDLAADRKAQSRIHSGSRGANGIDGQLSAFLGEACGRNYKENWAIVGDQTAIYDLGALQALAENQEEMGDNSLSGQNFRIVVINNGGGQIFRRVKDLKNLSEEVLRNQFLLKQNFSFADWAQSWGWGYCSGEDLKLGPPAARRQIVEVRPDLEQSQSIWSALANFQKELRL